MTMRWIAMVLMATLLSSSGVGWADEGLDRAIARREKAHAQLSLVLQDANQGLAALENALNGLGDSKLLFKEYDEESDKLTLVLVTKSGEVVIEAERQLLVDQCLRKKAETLASNADNLACRVNQLPCQLDKAIRSYRIGKALSFLTGLGAGAAISGGGGAIGATATVW